MSVGNQVEKPRFFIDFLQYQYEIGNVGTVSETGWGEGYIYAHTLGLNPTKAHESIDLGAAYDYQYFKVGFKNSINIPDTKMFISLLGHNFASEGYTISTRFHYTAAPISDGQAWVNSGIVTDVQPVEDIVNMGMEYDGWSMGSFTPGVTSNIAALVIKVSNVTAGKTFKIGGIAFGSIYEPEFHADLAVTQSRIMDGIKNKNTKGGSTYSVINYTKPANWWTGSPFELTDPNNITSPTAFSNARIGRRSWDVGFSQLSDRFYTDGVPNGVFPANDMVNKYDTDITNGGYLSDQDYDSTTNQFNYNINNDTSLYSTVYHHTLGGSLAFLFSPSQDNSPQNFAICRFDKPGFKVTQKSYKKFNIKMKINESW
tara:strand:+ start:10 stop:1122 length:1113 start_codon:yes stop_codon:yes gene_type:complete